jgi:hypothetical protein
VRRPGSSGCSIRPSRSSAARTRSGRTWVRREAGRRFRGP